MKEFYAHSLDGIPIDEWHLLDEHLKNTAELAKSFADVFGSGEWAYLAGLWHDIGKGF
ncbi:MAG: HD domain-containing protein [Candidatus Scalindua sediminis]|nr:HD domain-containing protein [Candidatus Scalindua sediminis]